MNSSLEAAASTYIKHLDKKARAKQPRFAAIVALNGEALDFVQFNDPERESKLCTLMVSGSHVIGIVSLYADETSQVVSAESELFPLFANDQAAFEYLHKLQERLLTEDPFGVIQRARPN